MFTLFFKMLDKANTIIDFHALTNDTNKKDIESVEKFWRELEKTMDKILKHHSYHNGRVQHLSSE